MGVKFGGGGIEETGGGGPGGLRIWWWVGGRRAEGLWWSVVRQGGVKLGPPSHFLFRFLGPGEPAAIDLARLPPPPAGPWGELDGRGGGEEKRD